MQTDAADRAVSVQRYDVTLLYTYEATRTRVQDGLGNQWLYEFDARGMTTRVTDPEGGATQITRHATTGDVDASDRSDVAGARVHTRRTTSTDAIHGARRAGRQSVWTYEWDTNGRLRRSVNPVGTATGLDYDTQGRLIREVVDLNGDGTAESVQEYERDAQGDIRRRGSIPLGRRTNYVYSAKGQITTIQPACLPGTPPVCPEFGWSTTAPGK